LSPNPPKGTGGKLKGRTKEVRGKKKAQRRRTQVGSPTFTRNKARGRKSDYGKQKKHGGSRQGKSVENEPIYPVTELRPVAKGERKNWKKSRESRGVQTSPTVSHRNIQKSKKREPAECEGLPWKIRPAYLNRRDHRAAKTDAEKREQRSYKGRKSSG